MSDEITLPELIRLALDTRQRNLHTALPGHVVSYDAATQTASIDLLVELSIPKRSGGHGYEKIPTLHGVPVGHPAGGGFVVHFPLAPGDHVWVMFAERSLDEVIRSGSRSQPRDLRMHDLSFAYAIPAASPDKSDALEAMPPNALVIGGSGGVLLGSGLAAQAMILGTAHVAALTTLATALDTLNLALVVPTGVAAPAKVAFTAAINVFKAHLLSAALSVKHKIDG
jgi:hypothetical protein